MKKILVLAIIALGISTNVFACSGNSMIEDIMADKIIRSKELEDITKKEMKLIKKHGYEFLLSDEFRKQIKKEMTKNLEKKK